MEKIETITITTDAVTSKSIMNIINNYRKKHLGLFKVEYSVDKEKEEQKLSIEQPKETKIDKEQTSKKKRGKK